MAAIESSIATEGVTDAVAALSLDDDDDEPAAVEVPEGPLATVLRAVLSVEFLAKAEQQHPQRRTPLDWRRETDAQIAEALSEADAVVLGAGTSDTLPLALFEALEAIVNACIDDPGTSDHAAAERLKRAAAITRSCT